jgi:hypothetical protein
MRAWVFLIVGALAALTGLVWTLQGLNVLGGSPMTGQTLWAVVGPIVVLIGVGLVVFGARGLRRPS